MRSGTGRGRQGPGLLRTTARPAQVPGGAARAHPARPQEGPPEQQRIDTPPGRWLPRHQPWNASSHALGGTGRSVDELAAQLDELGELRQAGLLTDEEFARQRAWLLGT